MYLGLAPHVEKVVMHYNCEKLSGLLLATSKQQGSWRRRGDVVQELKGSREDETLFSSSTRSACVPRAPVTRLLSQALYRKCKMLRIGRLGKIFGAVQG